MRRWLFKALRISLMALLGLCAIVSLFLCIERSRGAVSLARYKRQLSARGEAMTPRELMKPAPEGANGAVEVVKASQELIKGMALPDHYPPRMRLTPSGEATVGFRQAQWTEEKATYNWDQLAADLAANHATLERIRLSLETPVLDNQLDYSQGPKMRFTHLAKAKSLTCWFGSACQLALHQNRLQDCLDPLIAEIRLPRLLERDRILISELVRIALAAIARTDTWEALQADGWTDDQLARIQKAWEECRFLTNYTRSLEGECVFATITFEFCRRSNAEAGSLLFWQEDFLGPASSERPAWEVALRAFPAGDTAAEFLKKQVYCGIWRFAWLDQCERKHLQEVQQLVETSRAAEKSLSLASVRPQSDLLAARAQNRNWYDELRFPFGVSSVATLSHAVNRAMRAETERSLALAAIALKRYGLQQTNPPASLASLVPQFLAAVPIDYMDGKPIKYFLSAEGTPVLYSIGEDGVDNRGDKQTADSSKVGGNWWARKDLVWPAPAAPGDSEPTQKGK